MNKIGACIQYKMEKEKEFQGQGRAKDDKN